jgi:hypothetical protein
VAGRIAIPDDDELIVNFKGLPACGAFIPWVTEKAA